LWDKTQKKIFGGERGCKAARDECGLKMGR
jgi:hypothetical protein